MGHIFLEMCTHLPWDQPAQYSATYQKLHDLVDCQYLFSGRLKYILHVGMFSDWRTDSFDISVMFVL